MSITPNALYKADCLELLERMDNECAALVYLDPPWYSHLDWKLSAKGGSAPKRAKANSPKDDALFDEYVDWLSRVLQHSYRIVKAVGNIVVHAEPRIISYVRLIAEELFDEVEFTEIVWRRPRFFARGDAPHDEHEILLVCRKSKDSVWNKPTRPLTNSEIKERFNSKDSRGYFALSDLTVSASRPTLRYEWHGFSPPKGKVWKFSLEMMERLHNEGRIYVPPTGKSKPPYLKNYADEAAEIPVGNVWDDIHLRVPSSERTDFVAQQPLALLERVIKVGSNDNDLIIDPFCGSGTTIVVAQTLGRQWVACDNTDMACEISKGRLETINLKPVANYIWGQQEQLEKHEIVQGSDALLQTSFSRRRKMRFIRNQPVPVEETKYYEFKEIKGMSPVSAIENMADEYSVAFLNSEGGRIFWGIRNDDRVTVGVLLTYRQRDEVSKAIDHKLSQIQPAIAPSTWRVEFHQVYENGCAIPDLFVVELIVPRASQSNFLYGTGKGEVFVKTNSGKKKLSLTELQAELLNRLAKQ
jgi:DNA modification methylase